MIVLGFDVGAETGTCELLVDVPQKPVVLARHETMREPWRWLRDRLGPGRFGKPPVDLVAIEAPGQVFARPGFGVTMASALADSREVVGRLKERAEEHGVAWVVVTRGEWTRRLAKYNASDAEAKAAIYARLQNAPTRSNSHERDAMGAAIFAAQRAMLASRAPLEKAP